MEKKILKYLKKESGITLTALVATVIVLVILSVPLIMKRDTALKYEEYNNFKKDLLNLKEAVINLYGADGELSSDQNSDNYIGPEYKDWSTFVKKVENLKQGSKEETQNPVLNPNDKKEDGAYLIIDYNNLNKKYLATFGVRIQSLNFGKRNKDLSNTTMKDADGKDISDDVYIINTESKTIYYVRGYTINGTTYYRYQEPYTEIK